MSSDYDINKIMQLLPHRYPFSLVDRILEVEPKQKIIALKNVSMNEPFFQGHFPGRPVMPGVLIIEALAQAGGLLAALEIDTEQSLKSVFLMGLDKVRFRRPVIPGDQLLLHVTFLRRRLNAIKMSGRALVDDQVAAEAELMASLGEFN